MRASRTLFVLPVLGLALSACTGKGIGWSVDSSPPLANALPNLDFVYPASDLFLRPGDRFQILFVAKDSDDVAEVTLLADQDGDLTTLTDQFVLGTAQSDRDGQVQRVDVEIPRTATLGAYVVVGSVDDNKNKPVKSEAPGKVIVNAAPVLQISAPGGNVTVSRGGLLTVAFAATDADDRARVELVADLDGDPATTHDQYPILAGTSDTTGSTQTAMVSLTGVPTGSFHVLGIASDGHPPASMAAAAGRVAVVNVAMARSNGGIDYEEGRGVAIFPDRSWVVVGRFGGTAVFGQWPNATVLNSLGDDDMFIARYHASGELAWVTSAGGVSSGDWANSVAALADGSCVMTGYFHGYASFGHGSARVMLTSLGEEEGFVARYDQNGSLTWVKRAGGAGRQVMTALAALQDGSVAVTGCFERSITFGEGAAAVTLTAPGPFGSCDTFVARYSQSGDLQWVRQYGGPGGDDIGRAIAVLADGGIVVAGSFDTQVTFANTTLTAEGGKDAFLACLEPGGTLRWAHRAGGASDDEARGVCATPDGTCVLTGLFRGLASFTEGTSPTTLTATGLADLFLARYAADGSLTWCKRAGGTGFTEGSATASLADGSCLVTGSFSQQATFGTVTLSAAGWPGATDVFLARYLSDGTLAWCKRAGGMDHDRGNAIATLPDGASVVSGVFTGTATFGTAPAQVNVFASGFGDMFVARFNGDGDF